MTTPSHDAAYYNRLWGAAWRAASGVSPLRASRERLILREIRDALAPGVALLDVGCGDGHLLSLVRDRFPQVRLRGVDFAEGALADTPASLRERIVVGDITNLAACLPGERFEVVVCSEVLEHVDDPQAVLRAIASVLAPRGLVVVTVPGGMRYWSDLDVAAGHCRRFEHDELGAQLAAAGLDVERVYGWGALVGRLYYRVIRSVGAGGVSSAARSPLAALAGRVATEAMRLDDLLPRRGAFQLVARARGR